MAEFRAIVFGIVLFAIFSSLVGSLLTDDLVLRSCRRQEALLGVLFLRVFWPPEGKEFKG